MSAIKLSITERAILANQFDILAKLEPNKPNDHELKRDILEKGYEGLYYKIFDDYSGPVPKSVKDEVEDILSMYDLINSSVDDLTEDEQNSINADRLAFKGFDLNNGPHYGVFNFLIDRMDLYMWLKDMYRNAHTSGAIDRYRRVLVEYNKIKPESGFDRFLTKDELAKLSEVALF